MIMYVFDRRWHTKGVKDGGITAAKHAKGVVVNEFIVEEAHTIPVISVFIVKHAKNHKIKLLRLCGHGDAGDLQLGTGLTIDTQPVMLKLKQKQIFAPNAVVELRGCGVASATPLVMDGDGHNVGYWQVDGIGHKFLKALALTLGTTVKAAVEGQVINPDWAFQYQVVTVTPDGRTTVTGQHS